MNDLKPTSVLQKLYKNSTREGQVSLVSTHDVTNPPVHYCNWSLVYFVSKIYQKFTMLIIIEKISEKIYAVLIFNKEEYLYQDLNV